MRISDWSSDVCSSDLGEVPAVVAEVPAEEPEPAPKKTRRRPRARKDEAAEAPEAVNPEKAASEAPTDDATSAETPAEPVVEKPKRRSEEHTSELQSLMRISYAVFCLKKNTY